MCSSNTTCTASAVEHGNRTNRRQSPGRLQEIRKQSSTCGSITNPGVSFIFLLSFFLIICLILHLLEPKLRMFFHHSKNILIQIRLFPLNGWSRFRKARKSANANSLPRMRFLLREMMPSRLSWKPANANSLSRRRFLLMEMMPSTSRDLWRFKIPKDAKSVLLLNTTKPKVKRNIASYKQTNKQHKK